MAGVVRETPETNLVKSADLARVREVDFVYMFSETLAKLIEALGITRKIPKQAGTVLKYYKAVGTLESGDVAEGQLIPLSHYRTEAVSFEEIKLEKWRKATTAEAIIEKGYDQAVLMTNAEMKKDIQRDIRKKFFASLAKGTGTASGAKLQPALANAWGKLQVLFEDDAIEAVYFLNPEDVAAYLGEAQIIAQTAFGMTYIVNFLGLGTVIMNGSVPKGTFYATAKNNLILYYINASDSDLNRAFDLTMDELGLIGMHEEPDYKTMTAEMVATSGVTLFAERIDGVVVGTIGGGATGTSELSDEDTGA